MKTSGWLNLAVFSLAVSLALWAAEELHVNQLLVVVVLVLAAVAAILIAIHELGEAKDRWVTKLSGNRRVQQLVAWSRKGVGQLTMTVLALALVGAVVGSLVFVGVFFAYSATKEVLK